MAEAMVDTNSGGRVKFKMDSETRFIQLDGTISGIHLINQERSDRNGHVLLRDPRTDRIFRVHHRRILPPSMDGLAVVIESQDLLWALCPEDGQPSNVHHGDDVLECSKCSKSYKLHWTGVKSMAETKTVSKSASGNQEPKATKAAQTAATKKPEKVVQEPTKLDISDLAKSKHCELYVKKNVKFDHHSIDVRAYIMLYVGNNPRKLCFNTYDGALGKKAGTLPIDSFIKNEPINGKKPWFYITDIEKAKARLQKDNYDLVK